MGQEASNGSNDRRLTTGGSGRQTISAALHQVLSVNDHNASCKPIRGKAAIRMPGHAPSWITFAVPTARCFHWPAGFRCTMHHDGLPFVVAAIVRSSSIVPTLSNPAIEWQTIGNRPRSPLSLIKLVFTES